MKIDRLVGDLKVDPMNIETVSHRIEVYRWFKGI